MHRSAAFSPPKSTPENKFSAAFNPTRLSGKIFAEILDNEPVLSYLYKTFRAVSTEEA